RTRSVLLQRLLLFSLCPPAPLFPLFPYTTLFRSLAGADGGAPLISIFQCHQGCAVSPQGTSRGVREESSPRALRLRSGTQRGSSDRKSTRLNSSHVKTSYAAFCLKKTKSEFSSNM